MRTQIYFYTLILFLFFPGFAVSQIDNTLYLELVESIPIETDLDNPGIRNTYQVWLEMIDNVRASLDIEQFYISNQKDEPLEDILAAIIKAAERGVKVRIIVDARMYKTYPETVDMLGKQNNITTRIIDFGKLTGGVQHAKFFIIDQQEIFMGSQNFDWRALKHIHEIGVRVKHREIVRCYQDIFDLDWQLTENNDPSEISKLIQFQNYQLPATLHVNDGEQYKITPTMSPKGLILDSTLWDEKQIVDMIEDAKNEIVCQFLTYSPAGRGKTLYPVLDNALRRAAVRGVNVKMIVSDWAKDHPTVDHLKSLSLVPNIQIKFSVLPEWSGGYIPYARVDHCKFLAIDTTKCWLGTSNWEKSYFYTSRNLGIVIKNLNVTQTIKKIFYKSWDSKYTELIQPEIEYEPRKHGEN
ncbi:MAG: phospholipase D-like domain-containing protein [Bacteroidota bacterium]|nr:phospholipase D-like domain-containing protein [Bacteroidota bacterium]